MDLHDTAPDETAETDRRLTAELREAAGGGGLHSFAVRHEKARVAAALFGEPLTPTKIGRFTIVRELGAGGMGVVYVAYDEQLDRRVAVKLLRRADTDTQGKARLEREAQALARLSHPNVVTVHEVGTYHPDGGVHGGHVFVAMEFVAGQTLGEWMHEHGRPRPWPEVLAVFVQAGRGLAAAHAAGLIHRDFKPDNVMIGDDGRVRVMDFGLARAEGRERDEGELALAEPTVDRLTRTGAVMGTPAYMPLEQFEAGTVDARSDQFSFCVALYEALYGERPFAGGTVAKLVRALEHEAIREVPVDVAVPAWLHRVVVRGLARDPARRWASMDALLDALLDDPKPRRRRRITAGLLAAMIGGASWAVITQADADASVCSGAEATLAGVWDADRRAEVEQAVLATELSYAAGTWTRVEARLDAYAEAYVAARTEACEASHRGEQSSELLDLRMACLDERLGHLRATVDELARADAKLVEQAVEVVQALPTLDRCADARALRAALPPPDDPAVAERVAELEERLVVAEVREAAGSYAEAAKLADAVVDEALALGYEPLLARAWVRQGSLQGRQGHYGEAEATLRKALDAAVAWRMMDEAAAASTRLTLVVGGQQARIEDGRAWAAHADSFSRAAGTSEARAAYFEVVGLVTKFAGDLEQARAHHERALALWTELGPDHPGVARSLNSLGNVAKAQGEYEEARGYHGRALASGIERLGPEHPLVVAALNNLANVAYATGEFAEARRLYERVLALHEQALGREHPLVGQTLANLGSALIELGEYDQARACHERALSIRRSLGPDHADVAHSLNALGSLAEKQGDYAEARARYEQALEVWTRALGSDHHNIGYPLANLGNVAKAEHDYEGARDYYERARALWRAKFGDEHPLVAWVSVDLAETLLELDRPGEALALVEHAATILGDQPAAPNQIAWLRFTLARALVASDSGDRARAVELAELARHGYAEAGERWADRVAIVDAWLADYLE